MSLIPLLFYVLVKPTQHCTRQVCSKTICQPSLVTRSLAFDTELGVLSWLSILERGTAGSRNSRQMLDSRLVKTSRQTFGESYLPAFFFSPGFPLGICHSIWGQVIHREADPGFVCPSPAVLLLHKLSKLSEASVNSWNTSWAGFLWYLSDLWKMHVYEWFVILKCFSTWIVLTDNSHVAVSITDPLINQ